MKLPSTYWQISNLWNVIGKEHLQKIVFEVDYCKNSLPFADQRDKYLYLIWSYYWLERRNSFMIIKKSLYGSSILTDIRIIVLRLLIRNIPIVICNEVFYFSRWKKVLRWRYICRSIEVATQKIVDVIYSMCGPVLTKFIFGCLAFYSLQHVKIFICRLKDIPYNSKHFLFNEIYLIR